MMMMVMGFVTKKKINSNGANVYRFDDYRDVGFSARCVRDEKF